MRKKHFSWILCPQVLKHSREDSCFRTILFDIFSRVTEEVSLSSSPVSYLQKMHRWSIFSIFIVFILCFSSISFLFCFISSSFSFFFCKSLFFLEFSTSFYFIGDCYSEMLKVFLMIEWRKRQLISDNFYGSSSVKNSLRCSFLVYL